MSSDRPPRRGWAWVLLVLVLAVALAGETGAQSGLPAATPAAGRSIDPALRRALAALPAGEQQPVIVRFRAQASLADIRDARRPARLRRVIDRLQANADASQGAVRAQLAALRSRHQAGAVTPFWIFNGLAATLTPAAIAELAARPEVLSITADGIVRAPRAPRAPPVPAAEPAVETNIGQINAPALWALGFRGQGVVVANTDTGVSVNHADLASRWRGGTNSWFDPHGQHSTPTDLSGYSTGHGSWTMGVMVGGAASGTAIGVAPEAQWIAVKIFDDTGDARYSDIHRAFQWLLDPDGDPGTDDAPNVVNNSWGYTGFGCSLEFQPDLQALRAAGILPVFSAGNQGPAPGSNGGPANNPSALAVGGVNSQDNMYTYSSRGPSTCSPGAIFPQIVAPGVYIRSSDVYGGYYNSTGTSLAAPHVAGAIALLLSVFPDLTPDQVQSALLNSAVDLGSPGPDNDFGYGRLDVAAAYQQLVPSAIIPVTGLSARNDGPHLFGRVTTLTATMRTGADVTFEWDFGDGSGAAGSAAVVQHTYTQAGRFTAVVTATNVTNSSTAGTLVSARAPQYFPILGRGVRP